jgi:hypothetical protein
MAVLTFSDISTLALDELQANVSTDAPISAAEMARAINHAYSIIWKESGGTLTVATHATLWTPSPAVSGTQTMAGALTSIEEIIHLWVGTTVGSTGASTGDTELKRVELSKIQWRRSNSTGIGTYAESKEYAVSKASTTTAANVNKLTLEVWPASAGTRYYPGHYIPQFTEIDAVTVTTPDVNEIQSRDIGYMVALSFADRLGRAEFAPRIAAMISESTREMQAFKESTQYHGRQDK